MRESGEANIRVDIPATEAYIAGVVALAEGFVGEYESRRRMVRETPTVPATPEGDTDATETRLWSYIRTRTYPTEYHHLLMGVFPEYGAHIEGMVGRLGRLVEELGDRSVSSTPLAHEIRELLYGGDVRIP